jgi:hypothetical protein
MVLLTLFGLLFVALPWLDGDGRLGGATATTGLVLLGLATLTAPLATYLRFFAPRNAAARVHLVEGEGIEVRLRPHLLVGTLLVSVAWSAFFVWAALAAGLDGAGLLVVPLLLLSASLAPDATSALLRRPRLLVGPDRLDLRGWQTDASLAWEDVTGVDYANPDVRRPVLRIQGRPGAPSWQGARRRLLLRIDPPREEGQIDLPLLALDEPAALQVFLDQLRTETREQRAGRLEAAGVAFLNGSMQRSGDGSGPGLHPQGA